MSDNRQDDALIIGGEHARDEVTKWSARDAQRLPEYYAMLDRVVGVLRELKVRTPPNVSDDFVLADWLVSLDVAKRLRHLDMRGHCSGRVTTVARCPACTCAPAPIPAAA